MTTFLPRDRFRRPPDEKAVSLRLEEMGYELQRMERDINARITSLMPKNTRSRGLLQEGHLHGLMGGGGVYADYIIDGSYTGPPGAIFRTGTGFEGRVFARLDGTSGAVAHANSNRSSTGQDTIFFIAPGDYTVTSTISPTPPAIGTGNETFYHFVGSGRYRTTLTSSGIVAGGGTKLFDGGSASDRCVTWSGMTLVTAEAINLITAPGAAASYITDVAFIPNVSTATGIDPNGPGGAQRGCWVRGCSFVGSGTGINSPSAIAGLYVDQSRFINLLRGIFLTTGSDAQVHVDQCYFDTQADIAFGGAATHQLVTITGNDLSFGIVFTGSVTCRNIVINDNAFNLGASDIGIDWSAMTNASVQTGINVVGNTFKGVAGAQGIKGKGSPNGGPRTSIVKANTFIGFTSGQEIQNMTDSTQNAGNKVDNNVSDAGTLSTLGSGLIVQEDDVTVDGDVTTLDFTDSDATVVTSSPAQEANVNLGLYALLAGRATPQTIAGSSTTVDQALTLKGSAATSNAFSPTATLLVDIPAGNNPYTPAVTINEGGTFSAADTTLTVNDATAVEVGDCILIDTEILKVSAKAGNNLTVVRAQCGTTATTHADLVPVVQAGGAFVYSSAGDPFSAAGIGQAVLIDSEIMQVITTNAVTDVVGVIRSTDGTTAAAHSAGAAITKSNWGARTEVNGSRLTVGTSTAALFSRATIAGWPNVGTGSPVMLAINLIGSAGLAPSPTTERSGFAFQGAFDNRGIPTGSYFGVQSNPALSDTQSTFFGGVTATLAAAITTTAATTFTYTSSGDPFTVGQYIVLDDEAMFVSAIDTGTNTLTVIRGRLNTVASTHTTGANIILVNTVNYGAFSGRIRYNSGSEPNTANAAVYDANTPISGTPGTLTNIAAGLRVRNQGNAQFTNAYGIKIEPQSGSTLVRSLFVDGTAISEHRPGLMLGTASVAGSIRDANNVSRIELPSTGRVAQAGTNVGAYSPAVTVTAPGITTTTQTTFVYTSTGDPIAVGHHIVVDAEAMFVSAVDTTTNTLTVTRGALGTTAATHTTGTAVTQTQRIDVDVLGGLRATGGFYTADLQLFGDSTSEHVIRKTQTTPTATLSASTSRAVMRLAPTDHTYAANTSFRVEVDTAGGITPTYTLGAFSPAVTLLNDLGETDTTVYYSSAGDPVAINDYIIIDGEIMLVTNRDTGLNTLTVTRAQLETAATYHAALLDDDSANYRSINKVTITTTQATFRWSDDGGVSWDASLIPCKTRLTAIGNGQIFVWFEGANFLVGDRWDWTAIGTANQVELLRVDSTNSKVTFAAGGGRTLVINANTLTGQYLNTNCGQMAGGAGYQFNTNTTETVDFGILHETYLSSTYGANSLTLINQLVNTGPDNTGRTGSILNGSLHQFQPIGGTYASAIVQRISIGTVSNPILTALYGIRLERGTFAPAATSGTATSIEVGDIGHANFATVTALDILSQTAGGTATYNIRQRGTTGINVFAAPIHAGSDAGVAAGTYWDFAGASVSPGVGVSGQLMAVGGTLVEAASGTHAVMAGLRVNAPTITNNAAATSDAASVYVAAAPSVGTRQWGLFVDAGNFRVDDQVTFGATTVTSGSRLTVATWPNLGAGSHNLIQTTLAGTQSAPATAKRGFGFSQAYDLNGNTLTDWIGVYSAPEIKDGSTSGTANLLASYAAFKGQVIQTVAVEANITNSAVFWALAPQMSSGAGTAITTHRGVYVPNQGSDGIATSIGVDIEAQSGSSTANIGLRVAKGNTYALQLSDTGGTAAGGITWGTDTNLYRSAADRLKTDDALMVVGNVGFNNATPAAPPTYSESNVTTDRTYDANATSIDELADVVGSMIADLRAVGLFA